MKKCFVVLAVAVVLFSTGSACWGWLIYHKPEFRGRVVDAETKEPIEGAVVVVLYWKRYLMGGPGGPSSTIFNARETLTDVKGEFFFPSYTTVTPLARETIVQFIIFKPGYIHSLGPNLTGYFMREKFFSSDDIGKMGEIRDGLDVWKGILGVVELKKANNCEERRRSVPGRPFEVSKELPLFFKIIEEEDTYQMKEGCK